MRPLISVVLPSLIVGGVERMRIGLIEEFIARGYRVDVVLVRKEGSLLSEVPPEARVFGMSESGKLRGALAPMARYLRAERPEAVLAAMWPLTTIALAASLAGGRPRTVVSDHNVLSRQAFARGVKKRAALRATIGATYPMAAARVAVSDDVADDVAELGRLERDSLTVIPNPAYPSVLGHGAPDPWENLPGGDRVLTVGRLKPQKDIPTLVEAFARVAAKRPTTLVVLGDGPERGPIERRARDLGVADRVVLPGFAAETGPWYAHADVFGLASRYEGFGNVIVEALAHGLPVVCTDSPGGASGILDGGTFGRLVPVGDVAALTVALEAALDQGGRGAAERLARAQEYAPGPIAERYLNLLFP